MACGPSDLPITSDQPRQESTTAVVDRAESTPAILPDIRLDEPESTPPPSQSAQSRNFEDTGPTAYQIPNIQTRGVEESQSGPEPETQDEGLTFPQVIAREFPGLLTLPECRADTQLTMAPLEDNAYKVIIPLGLLATPQHVLPTSHIYYQLVRESTPSSNYGPPAVAEVRPPGNIRILSMNSSESTGPRGTYIDYDMTFAPCRGCMYQFLHVSTLIPELEALFEAGLTGRCDEYGDAQSQYRLCKSSVELDLAVGTVLGTTGGKVSAALDLEAYDLEGPSLGYANPARFGSEFDLRLKVVCLFDDFTAEVQEQQLVRMGDYDNRLRTAEPRCGEVMQDIPGTAQGNWYTGEASAHANWSQELALVHDNVDPALAAISIGGIVSTAGVWLFTPETNGLVNRDFPDIVADGRTYCYERGLNYEGGQKPIPFVGRLLISLTSDTEMLVEQQDSACDVEPSLVDPVIYRR